MKNIYKALLLLLFGNSIGILAISQQFINKEWEIINSTPGQYDYVSSALCPNGNLIVTGNNLSGSNCNIYTNCVTPNGNSGWTQTCTGASGQNHYGSDVTTCAAGNVYVSAAVHNGTNYDYRINKYSATGTLLWQRDYNGTGNNDDVPSAIVVDASGNVYVTGTSYGVNSYTDFATLKIDGSNGTVLWTKRYNFNNNPEVAIDIALDGNGSVLVCGSSANNLLNSDFTVVKYNPANGNQTAVKRHNSQGSGYDLPSEMVIDGSNNVYLIGTSNSNTSNKDIKLIAYNSSLNVTWVNYIDKSGSSDEGYGITLDGSGNLIIAGYWTKSNGGTDFITAKYNGSNGNQVWLKNRCAPIDNQIAKGRKVKTDALGNIFVVGDIDFNGSRDFLAISYDALGNTRWEKTYNNSGNGADNVSQLVVNNEEIYVTGKSDDGTGEKITTVKFSTKQKPLTPVYINGVPSYNDNEIVIRFDPSMLNYDAIDKKEFQVGILADFVKPFVITAMEQKFMYDWKNASTFKIFTNMTSADTVSISRLGDEVRLDDFWATLSVFVSTDVSEEEIVDSLELVSDSLIHYAHLNSIIERNSIPNDQLITNSQESLIPTGIYPNANISIDGAWNLEVGQWHTRVGVFDDPIYWAHEDFGDGTYSGSKIEGGYDYFNNVHISGVASPGDSHGTSCAGIIGGLRNNGLGIAGIAGGDVDGASNVGVQLYSMGIFSSGTFSSITTASNAIVEGSSFIPSTGFGYDLDIQNHSWSTNTYTATLNTAVIAAWRNHSILVASRGNDGNSDLRYPACFADPTVLNCAASGTNGEYKDFTNGDNWYASSYGNNVDFSAPGSTEIVSSTIFSGAPLTLPNGCTSILYPDYQCFTGTSSAAPHVSGVAALMHSKHHTNNGAPNNLATEDIENLLQKNATDKGSSGYDQFNGWGLINASSSLNKVNYPAYYVKHSNNASPSQSITPNLTLIFTNSYNGIIAGTYIVDRYQLNWTYVDVLPSTDVILDWWPLDASTYKGVSAANPNSLVDYMVVTPNVNIGGNTASFSVTTYALWVKQSISGSNVYEWIPSGGPSSLKYAYSLHVQNTSVMSVDENEQELGMDLYPNPTDNVLNIQLSLTESVDSKLEIFDIQGKLIANSELGIKTAGEHEISINVSNLASGMYVVKIYAGENMITERFVKE